MPSAGAIDFNDPYWTRPSLWAPTYIEAQMGYQDWGNVAYFFQWELDVAPDSLTAWENKGASDAESLEIGWKRTGGGDCNRTFDGSGLTGTAGFPSGMSVRVDYTEEDDDAVLFVADMDVLAADQRANRNKSYLAWWKCNDAFDPGKRPYFNVQQGDGEHPLTSDSNGQMNYVPAENGARGFPDSNTALDYVLTVPGTHKTTAMYAPWTVNSNFELSDYGWYSDQARHERICGLGAGGDGSCYLRVHTEGFGPDTWIGQSAYTANSVAKEGGSFTRLPIGTRTNFQYEGLFRCPQAWNSTNCVFDIWLKGRTSAWDSSTQMRSFSVPPDARWYYVVVDDWPVGGNTDIFDLIINTRGRHLDIDTQWVSSGI